VAVKTEVVQEVAQEMGLAQVEDLPVEPVAVQLVLAKEH
jgi:hypothetical protein